MSKGKMIGLVGLCVSSVFSTIITVMMTDKEISKQLDERDAEKEKNKNVES